MRKSKWIATLSVIALSAIVTALLTLPASAQIPADPHSWWDASDPSGDGSRPSDGLFDGPWVNKGVSEDGLDAVGFGDYLGNVTELNGAGAWNFGKTGQTSLWISESNSAYNFLHDGSDATAVIVATAKRPSRSSSPRIISNNGGSGTVGIHITPVLDGPSIDETGQAHVWMTRGVGGSPAIDPNKGEDGVWNIGKAKNPDGSKSKGLLSFVVSRHQTDPDDFDFKILIHEISEAGLAAGMREVLGGNGSEDRPYSQANANGGGGGFLEFGSSDGGNTLWHGLYAEVILYDRALSSSEMTQLDNALLMKYTGIPEPATFALLGLGSMVLLRRRTRTCS